MSWRTFVVAALCALGLIVAVPAAASAACTTTWNGPVTGGSWETAASWSTGATPTATDEVCLPAGTEVTVSGSPSTARQIHGLGATLTVSGTLELADTAAVSRVGNVRLHGTVRGVGELRAVDGLAWSGGTLGGGVVLHAESTVNGTLDGGLLDGTTFRNDGDIVQSNGTLTARNGALFHNTGTFVLNASRCWGCSWDPGVQWSPNGDAQPRLVNTGTIRKTTSGSATISLGLDNDGTVAVDQGELAFTRGADGSVSQGDWTGAATGTAILDGPLRLGSGVQVAGNLRIGWSGDVRIGDIHGANASLTVHGTLRLDPGDASRVGTVTHTGTITGAGTLRAAQRYDLGGGQLTAAAAVHVEDTAAGTLTSGAFDGATLRNDGTLTLQGYTTVAGRNGAVIDNRGTFTLATTSCWGCSYQAGLV
ncbi:MAG TPA: hypothetical protein VN238_01980 [Solirubrobacteraceae bacterium]|nr:hypothetical protein [Solirubrobacteraceae bacterium]